MEKHPGSFEDEDQMDMPPGFRFHPTDEELITHYLLHKVLGNKFYANAIGEVDMNKIEPWDLPGVAKMGETEWYFFCVRDKKYPTGSRTNRATVGGYWKATGKDKEIFAGRVLIGMKKTLVFYLGRAPKGEKSNWVLHEYRLEGKFSQQNLPKSAKTEWVICRVYRKNSEKKFPISGGVAASLPPLMESPAAFDGRIINPSLPESTHVHCFSNPIEIQSTQKNMMSNLLINQDFTFESIPIMHQFPSGCLLSVYNHAILNGLIGSYGTGLKTETEMSSESDFDKGKREIERNTINFSRIGLSMELLKSIIGIKK